MSDGSYNLDNYSDNGAESESSASRSKTKRKSGLPPLPDQGDPVDRFAVFVTEFAHLEDDPVVSAQRWGTEGSEPIELVLRSGRRVGWPEQDYLFGARLQRPFVMVTGHKPRSLSQHETALAAWAIIQLAVLRSQTSEADEFRELWEAYLSDRAVRPIDRHDELAMRDVLLQWRRLADVRSGPDERPFVLVDIGSGERWVRRLDFALHVRSVQRAPISWARLHGLARRYGWELDRVQYRPTPGGAPYVDAKVFIVPAGWGEDA
jgi:hypothetical protein